MSQYFCIKCNNSVLFFANAYECGCFRVALLKDRPIFWLEQNEALDCLRIVQQLAGGQDWREWLRKIAIDQDVQRTLEKASHDITYGRE